MSKVLAVDSLGKKKLVEASVAQAADRLIGLKKQNKLWESIELMFKIWRKRHPKEWKSYLIRLKEIKETRKDKKFGRGEGKTTGEGAVRYTLDIPESVILMIRRLYSSEELPMNREFFLEFAKRFKKFQIPEKV